MKQVCFIILAVALSAISCKCAKESMQVTTPLYNTEWNLVKIYNNEKGEIVNTKAFIHFDKEKGSAGGNGSCNSFGSTAIVNENEVSFKNVFSTKMYCEDVQQIENNYLGKLEKVNRFVIKEKILFLYHDKEMLLEFMTEQ